MNTFENPQTAFSTTPPDAAAWDVFVNSQRRAHILQINAWGKLKHAYGWQVERVIITANSQIIAGAQLLFRPLPFRLGTMAYLPMGPYIAEDAPAGLASTLWLGIDAACHRYRAAFLKWEPGTFADEATPDFARLGFRESPQTIQPPRTVLIDISASDEAIMAGMNQGTRRKIRQSLKNNIHYYEATRDDLPRFNAMMHTTGARNEFGVHEPAYYELAYDLFVPQQAALILAEHDGGLLAGIMVFAAGRTAWYLYGASSDLKRNLMATYGVQWQAIQWAKALGCRTYDLWGIPDEDETTLETQFQNRSDGLWGVYGFKRGWGGQIVRSAGAWDKIYNPLIYTAYRLALKIRSES
jgi:peptidoglycan pentaglycine glycine transferase (the first glycine)